MDVPLRAEECRDVRGRFGHWAMMESEEDIRQAQYLTPIAGYAGNADLAWKPMTGATADHGPFRNATKYKWKDHFQDSCPVNVLTRQGLCDTLARTWTVSWSLCI